jgi:hypothetical protein
MADNDDKTVKQLLDAGTRADLERWFGLPSFEQLADQGKVIEAAPEDPEMVAAQKRRDDALASVDPVLVDEIHRRAEAPDLIKPRPDIQFVIDPSIARLDLSMIERQYSHLEPREVEIPPQLEDDLRNCTPQALLRDLHRPETTFDKVFEVVDMSAEQRLDGATAVAEVMAMRHHIEIGPSPFRAAYALILEVREQRRQPWTEIVLRNRGGS